MRRSTVFVLLALGLGAILLSWLLTGPWGQSLFRAAQPLAADVIAALPEVGLPEDAIRHGNLGLKYLTAEELRELKVSMDLTNVPYLGSLDLDRWAPVLPMDAIASITHPDFTTAEKTDLWLKDDDLVLGIVYRDIVRSYPVRILDRHEIINDWFGDIPVAVTYCPLCYSALVFKRPRIADQVLEFGVSGRLYNANLLMYDRQTGSLWDQFMGRVIAGPLLGKTPPLERMPVDVVSWGIWKQVHPDTQVLARPSQIETPRGRRYFAPSRYERYAYDEYRLKPEVGYGVDIRELDLKGMNSKRKIVGIVVNDQPKAYVEFVVKEVKIINDVVGREPILILSAPDDRIRVFRRTLHSQVLQFALRDGQIIDQETQTVWSFDGVTLSGPLSSPSSRLEELVVTSSFWFAWVAFYPDTELYSEAH